MRKTQKQDPQTTTMDGFPWGFGTAYRIKPIRLLHNGRQHAKMSGPLTDRISYVMSYIVGVDIGGTFTDCVVVNDQGEMVVGKSPSTPPDFSVGAADAVRDAARNVGLGGEEELLRQTTLFFHACTIGENTLITRSGPRTGLVTTRGFPDTLLMMRGKVTDGLTEAEAGRLAWLQKPEPFVPRSLVAEVNERVDYKGAVTVRLDEDQATAALDALVARGVESVAVCLLWSVANDVHEKAVAEILRRRHPGVYVTLSSAAVPFVGEYERTATTVFNAYIGPRISSYLVNLEQVLRSKGLAKPPMIMQSYGGVLDIEATCRNAVGAIESGPASGVVGTRFLGELIGEDNILATDMGGTTFKVGVVREGRMSGTTRRWCCATGCWRPRSGCSPWAPGAAALPGSRKRPACSKWGPKEPAPARDRCAMASAAPSPRSLTPTSSWAISTRTTSWAAGCGSTGKPRFRR